jgi:hypothetical protein
MKTKVNLPRTLWAAALAALLLAASLTSRADLVITEVMSSSSHTASAANGDWWELYNSGNSSIDLTGYSWDDNTATPGSADFNHITIGAGQAIIICQENTGAEQAWKDLWGASDVTVINLGNTVFQNFGSGGDEIHPFAPSSVQIASVSFGTATTGFSFEWDSAGNYQGIAVLGENGAFQATVAAGGGPDIASPGYVTPVPESGALALLACGGLVFLGRRCFLR